MRRFLVLALLSGVLVVVPTSSISAGSESAGCIDLNRDDPWDKFYASGHAGTPGPGTISLAKGEVLEFSADEPSSFNPTKIELFIDNSRKRQKSFPGTVTWRVNQDGNYQLDWQVDGNATWEVTCTPAMTGGEPLTVCHKGKATISVAGSALQTHLGHGDTQGACT